MLRPGLLMEAAVVSGRRHAGYAVTTSKEVIESGPLPTNTSAQKAEIIALIQALELAQGKEINIYMDSRTSTHSSRGRNLHGYMVALNKQLREIEKYVAGTQNRELDGPVHNVQRGDYVYVKSFAEKTLEPQWEGPFQVLLTTFTAIKIKEQKAWIHYSRVKKAPEGIWKATPGDNKLKLKLPRNDKYTD
ncbi:hypothetical protein DUI87_03100 [Hirundo rustica rustica]|uniref:Murine leukemia virus integrase C-terminal domain-containing protein n=1 Tax=Hirundo rustica rustica TaxID=333673 RepID=A0A3M0L2G1_HIRRU|nr:hypothetical protein DUI87_03100 [Hirundo rustica rustica]